MNIIFFYIESTGPNPDTDYIISLAAIKRNYVTGESYGLKEILVKPPVEIPAESTEVHGITNEMVSGKMPFSAYAKAIGEYFDGCILSGYNIRHFDVPLLVRELASNGVFITIKAILDSYKIYTLKERRDLSAAKKFYLNQTHEDAHTAGADTIAAMDIYYEQIVRYPELSAMTIDELDIYCNDGRKTLDIAGKIYINKDGLPTYSFGSKTKDVPVRDNIQFANWVISNQFPEDTKNVLRKILADLNQ